MFQIKTITFLISAFFFSESQASALKSTHIKDFEISQCDVRSGDEKNCLLAQGKIAFLSMSGNLLVASNVRLETNSKLGLKEHQTCSQFRFEIDTQVVICDNTSVPGGNFLKIDSKMKRTLLMPSAARIKS